MTVVIEGEVVSAEIAVLPPDVQTKVAELAPLDGPAQAARVTAMLSHARTGLLVAIAAQDLPQIMEWKQKASAIETIAKQVRLGKEMVLDAAEFVRRAERGLGVAIREGQERGEVATPAETASQAALRRDIALGRSRFSSEEQLDLKPVDTDFADRGELSGNACKGQYGIYGMTDGVSDERFEEALTEARDEGNLSRTNVARKAKAKALQKEPIDADDPLIDAEVEPVPKPSDMPTTRNAPEPEPPSKPKKRLTKHDSTEMLANINGMLNGIVESLPFIDPADIDAASNKAVITNIRHSMGSVRKLLKEIENG